MAQFNDSTLNELAIEFSITKQAHLQGAEKVAHFRNTIDRLFAHPDYVPARRSDGKRATLPGSISAAGFVTAAAEDLLRKYHAALEGRTSMVHIKDIQRLGQRMLLEIDDYQEKRTKLETG